MTEEEKAEAIEMIQCPFCNGLYDESKIIKIQPYRAPGHSNLIPYKTVACEKCFGEQPLVAAGDAPQVTEEVAEEEESESPNPMKGETMKARVEAAIGATSEKLADPEE